MRRLMEHGWMPRDRLKELEDELHGLLTPHWQHIDAILRDAIHACRERLKARGVQVGYSEEYEQDRLTDAWLALREALYLYDPAHGPFPSYANSWVSREIVRYAADEARAITASNYAWQQGLAPRTVSLHAPCGNEIDGDARHYEELIEDGGADRDAVYRMLDAIRRRTNGNPLRPETTQQLLSEVGGILTEERRREFVAALAQEGLIAHTGTSTIECAIF